MPKKQRKGLKDSGELKYSGGVDKQGGVTGPQLCSYFQSPKQRCVSAFTNPLAKSIITFSLDAIERA
jgi:hypothetical protein